MCMFARRNNFRKCKEEAERFEVALKVGRHKAR